MALCIAQTTSWGLLYYSLPVAVQPIVEDTGWTASAITGAFSLGLIVSAIAGIPVGRMLDRRGPRRLMTAGSIVGAAALVCVAAAPTLPVFFAAWLLAGFAQAAVFYQSAFTVITRWYGSGRVRALTALTLVAGLASTIYAPLTAFLIGAYGWRTTYFLLAGILVLVTLPLHYFFLNSHWAPPARALTDAGTRAGTARVGGGPSERQADAQRDAAAGPRRTAAGRGRFVTLQIAMSISTLAMFAVTINIIPLLLERGMDYPTAALTLGLIGAGQVLGRLVYGALTRRTSPTARSTLLAGAGALTLWGLAVLPGPLWLLIAIAIVAGAVRGCNTLLQATAVADRWGTQQFGARNGIFAAPVTIVGALAPAAGPLLAGPLGSYPAMAAVMAVLATAGIAAAARS